MVANHHDHNRSNETPTFYSFVASQSSSIDYNRTRSNQNLAASPTNLSTPSGTSFPPTTVANQKDYLSSQEEFQVQLVLAISASNSDSHYDQRLGSHQIDSRRNGYGHVDGPVKDANLILARWTERSTRLRTSRNTIVLPFGYINIGLSRHCALCSCFLANRFTW
ncbi:unnamed protein product [Lupinus luteus]|uniref:EDR1/CTR1/ARMC3-like peptidase-like domain-containing protein n=1 Tax=Lupinus luteus TaxID=3873 RepID=A0AAV1WUL9_LUPLU